MRKSQWGFHSDHNTVGWYSLGPNWSLMSFAMLCISANKVIWMPICGLKLKILCIHFKKKKMLVFVSLPLLAMLVYSTMRKFWKNFWNLAPLFHHGFILFILFLFLQINIRLESIDQIVETLTLHLCNTYFSCCAIVYMWIVMVFLLCDLKCSTMNFHYNRSH